MSVSKEIVLGVTGSIAAHKAADLASLLTRQKCDVRVVMTADAQRFITPLPFKTLTRHPVVTNLYDEDEGGKPTHIELADAADLLLIAPATANVMAKMAHGKGLLEKIVSMLVGLIRSNSADRLHEEPVSYRAKAKKDYD